MAAGFSIGGFLGSSAFASHAGGMDAMSIDMDPSAAPANTATSLGSREIGARINENDLLDADEDLVDSLLIDVTATNIPSSTSMLAFVSTLAYDAPLTSDLCVVAADYEFLLGANPGSSLQNGTDPTPDCDGTFLVAAIDVGPPPHESGSGVLARLTLEAQPGVQTGVIPISLPPQMSAHLDVQGSSYVPDQLNGAFICIDANCTDFDEDGVLNGDDLCLQIPGIPENDGCPPPGPPAVGGIAGLLDGPIGDAAVADTGGSPVPVTVLAAVAVLGSVVLVSGLAFAFRRNR